MRKLGFYILLFCLSACVEVSPRLQSSSVAERTVEPVPQNQKSELIRRQRLRELLANAQRTLSRDQLMYPFADCAFVWYQQVLAMDESNAEAHWGMGQISARYLVLAENAFINGQESKAELMLERALKVSATPEEVKKLRARYPQQPAAGNEYRLSPRDLSARNDKVLARLQELAKKAQKIDSRLLIIARNDAEGRWIYQQMRLAVDGYRLRGNIKIGRTPRVVLIDAQA
ncbi:MAG: hypothetical protein JKY66_02710 [Spongiibacteraceae bacterium]|nr:hypothetical protein [Spongiibacteraceae bacterium]